MATDQFNHHQPTNALAVSQVLLDQVLQHTGAGGLTTNQPTNPTNPTNQPTALAVKQVLLDQVLQHTEAGGMAASDESVCIFGEVSTRAGMGGKSFV